MTTGELPRYSIETGSGGRVLHAVRSDDGRWVKWADAETERLNQRAIGHGQGQEHAIADVNAGVIDDLIAPRLAEFQSRLQQLEEENRQLRESRSPDGDGQEAGKVAGGSLEACVDALNNRASAGGDSERASAAGSEPADSLQLTERLQQLETAALLKDRTRRAIRERAQAGESHASLAEDYGVPAAFITALCDWQLGVEEPDPRIAQLEQEKATLHAELEELNRLADAWAKAHGGYVGNAKGVLLSLPDIDLTRAALAETREALQLLVAASQIVVRWFKAIRQDQHEKLVFRQTLESASANWETLVMSPLDLQPLIDAIAKAEALARVDQTGG